MELVETALILILSIQFAATCTVEERLLLNKTAASPNYFIHSSEEVPDGIHQLVTLAKVLGFEFKIPFILDSSLFRLNVETEKNLSVQCRNDSSMQVAWITIMSPVNVSIATVLYGCGLHNRKNAKIFVVNDLTMNGSTEIEFKANYSRISLKFNSKICRCNERLDKFVEECLPAVPEERGVKLKVIAVFVVFLLIVSLVATFIAKSGQRSNNAVVALNRN